jgi:hypothetical protein
MTDIPVILYSAGEDIADEASEWAWSRTSPSGSTCSSPTTADRDPPRRPARSGQANRASRVLVFMTNVQPPTVRMPSWTLPGAALQ